MGWTKEQEYAISYQGPKNLVLEALAGTGKTTVLIARIYQLLSSGVNPRQVLMLTFSRRGAKDMRDKAAKSGMDLGQQFRTMHSIALWMLRGSVGSKNITVPKRWQVLKVIRNTLRRFPGVRKTKLNPSGLTPPMILKEIHRARADLVWPQEWVDKSTGELFLSFSEWLAEDYKPLQIRAMSRCFEAIESACKDPQLSGFNAVGERWFTFPMMIASTARSIVEGKALADCWTHAWADRYQHVFVDEAQDNNLGQWIIAQHLCGGRMTIVGDTSQAIFGFRGACPKFMESYGLRKDSEVAALTTNWRSGSAILDTANKVLSLAHDEAKPTSSNLLRLGRDGHRGTVEVDGYRNPHVEAEHVVDKVESLVSCGYSLSDVVALYRVNSYSAYLEMEFIRRGIMCRIAGSSFFGSPIVSTALHYLRSAQCPEDTKSFKRIYCKPLRGLGCAFLDQCPSFQALRGISLNGRYASGATKMLQHMEGVKRLLEENQLGSALRYVFEEIGLKEFFRDEEAGSEDETETDETCKALIECANRVHSLDTLLKMASILEGSGDGGTNADIEAVTLSTVHKFKGLERAIIFVVGVSQDLFPHKRGDYVEELRLGYVALTRAKDALYVSYTMDAGPSVLVKAIRS